MTFRRLLWDVLNKIILILSGPWDELVAVLIATVISFAVKLYAY